MNAKVILIVGAVLLSVSAQVVRGSPEEGQEQIPRANATRIVVGATDPAGEAVFHAVQAVAG
jgi:hypothetical protein